LNIAELTEDCSALASVYVEAAGRRGRAEGLRGKYNTPIYREKRFEAGIEESEAWDRLLSLTGTLYTFDRSAANKLRGDALKGAHSAALAAMRAALGTTEVAA